MLIPWYWLLIVGVVSIFPGLLAIWYVQIKVIGTNADVDTIKRDVEATKKLCNGNMNTIANVGEEIHKVTIRCQDVEVESHGTRALIEGVEESFRNLSNKVAARDRTERRAKKREEVDEEEGGEDDVGKLISAAGGIPLDQQGYGQAAPGRGQFVNPSREIPFGEIP